MDLVLTDRLFFSEHYFNIAQFVWSIKVILRAKLVALNAYITKEELLESN